MLKQDAVIEYLNELHKKYVLVPIDKAANNIAVICKKYYVTDKNHGHVLTGDLRIITNSKLRKLVSKGPNFREAMSINWNKCKREIEIGLDSSIERIVSTNPKTTMEEFVEWKRKILQEVNNDIISLKHQIKVQDAVIEYLNELHEKYVLVPIDKAANNIAIIYKMCYVTVILKEIGILDAGNETYEKINKNQEEIIQDNLENNTLLKLSNESKDKSLPIMY